MDVETLSRGELLMLLSILEGELEAQDIVIHNLRVRTASIQFTHIHTYVHAHTQEINHCIQSSPVTNMQAPS